MREPAAKTHLRAALAAMHEQTAPMPLPIAYYTVRENYAATLGEFYTLRAHYPSGKTHVLGYHASRAEAEDYGQRHIAFLLWLAREQPHHDVLREIGVTV